MTRLVPGVWKRTDPIGEVAPVVFDSPHSGLVNPTDFDFAVSPHEVAQTADSHVDRLMALAPNRGIPLLSALFPRAYIDVNRTAEDIDEKLLSDVWAGVMQPTEKSAGGMGLVRRLSRPGRPLYARQLRSEEIRDRLEGYYHPYHTELQRLLDVAYTHYGAVWHLNCHSMPSLGAAISLKGDWQRADFVLGDMDGRTCERAFRDLVAAELTDMGYEVKINDPYKGMELIRRYADPGAGRHALQLEINRKLYMDEDSLDPHEGFGRLQHDLGTLAERIAAYAYGRTQALAAD